MGEEVLIESASNSPVSTLNRQPDSPRPRPLWLRVRLIVLVFSIFVLFVSPIVYRGWRISRIPDIGLPFDAEPLLSLAVPDEDNAWFDFRKAITEVAEPDLFTKDAVRSVAEREWELPSAATFEWAATNRQAISIWKQGTRKQDAQYKPAAHYRCSEPFKEWRELDALHRAVFVEVLHNLDMGDVEAAWELCRSQRRASDLYVLHGDFEQVGLGASAVLWSQRSILRWMQSSQVSAASLVNALSELRTSLRPRRWISDAIQIDAIAIQSIDAAVAAFPERFVSPHTKLPAKLSLFLEGEPVLGRRVQMLRTANFLQNCELDIRSRPGYVGKSEFDALLILDKQTISSRKLRQLVDSSSVATAPHNRAYCIMLALNDLQQLSHELLVVAVALEIHKRQYHAYPESLSELVPHIVSEVPDNTFALTPTPIKYLKGTAEDDFDAKLVAESQRDTSSDVIVTLGVRPPKKAQ